MSVKACLILIGAILIVASYRFYEKLNGLEVFLDAIGVILVMYGIAK